jgi:hypothetical protein
MTNKAISAMLGAKSAVEMIPRLHALRSGRSVRGRRSTGDGIAPADRQPSVAFDGPSRPAEMVPFEQNPAIIGSMKNIAKSQLLTLLFNCPR